ncbi:hypothetical protein AJ88_22255 [Mesorhizobium amorphae CCBAU 01583]|nr:hypothetical protein AJ88_22255 [Mesorhizobium amorphae CCBAU 01583]
MQTLLKNAESLAKLELGGQKFAKHDILKILGNIGAAQAVQALLDNAEGLAKLEFSGQKLSKDDILQILGNNGATQAVHALLENVDKLKNMPKSRVLAAASDRRSAAAAIRKLTAEVAR